MTSRAPGGAAPGRSVAALGPWREAPGGGLPPGPSRTWPVDDNGVLPRPDQPRGLLLQQGRGELPRPGRRYLRRFPRLAGPLRGMFEVHAVLEAGTGTGTQRGGEGASRATLPAERRWRGRQLNPSRSAIGLAASSRLQGHRGAGSGWNGSGLPRLAGLAQSHGGAEDDPGRSRRRAGRIGPLPHRRPEAVRAPGTSEHRPRLYARSGTAHDGRPFFSAGVRRRAATWSSRYAARRSRREPPPPCWKCWPGPCITPTREASSIAT